MEFVLIQMSCLTVSSKQKNKNENTKYYYTKYEIHLHAIQKSGLLKTRGSYFSLVWVIEFSIISSCLGKVNIFSDSCNLESLVDVQSLHGNNI